MHSENTLTEQLLHRENELEAVIYSATTDLGACSPGFLRISTSHGHEQFYHRQSKQDKNGTYIHRSNANLIEQLAQREYATRARNLAAKQKDAIDALLHNPEWGLEQHPLWALPARMHPSKSALISPYELSDEAYAQTWQEQPYERKLFLEETPALYTEKNERVRSKSEIIIANMLNSAGIPYHYEKPLELSCGLLVHPDFTVLNARTRQEYVWEHLGMMDDPEYAERAVARLGHYGESGFHQGINLLVTYETARIPLDTRTVERTIRTYLQ